MKICALWTGLALIGISGLAVGQSLTVDCVTSGGTNCPARIPDSPQPGIVSSIVIPPAAATLCSGVSTGTTVSVQLNATHSAVGDLVVSLANPSSSTSTLLSNLQGAAGACQGSDILATFTDTGTAATCGALDPSVTGMVAPVSPLSALHTTTGAPAGTWNLTVTDNGNNGDGALNDWSLVISCGTPPPVPAQLSRTMLAWMALALVLIGSLVLRLKRRT